MIDESKRETLRRMAKGAIYAAPVILTMGAPTRLLAQISQSPLCLMFPVLCDWLMMWFPEQRPNPGGGPTGGPGGFQGAPFGNSPFAPPPGTTPPPGITPPQPPPSRR